MNSRLRLPREMIGLEIDDLPPGYKTPLYLCPNSIQFDIFKAEVQLTEPIDLSDLINTCRNDERILMNMYPGGSGMEVFFLLNNIQTSW